MKTFYIILAYFDYKERKRINNLFILTLDLYDISIKKVISNLELDINFLSKSVIILVNIGGYNILIELYSIVLIADILQTAENTNFIKYNINQDCKT